MFELKDIEFWEKYYLDQMEFMLLQDKDKMINALNSKDEIKIDWIDAFKIKSCDIDRGAERIYYWLLNQLGIPNSSPIGSDLLFETCNAFVHIDVKTSSYYTGVNKDINASDFKGVVSIGENQTSYEYKDDDGNVHSSNLPQIYKSKNKICLTYIIQLVYDKENDGNLKILGLVLISIPNGALKEIYGDEICGGSKNKNEAFRYYYKRNPNFKLLDSNPYRVKLLYLAKDFIDCEEKLIGFKMEKMNV
ncbi:MAG TPA: hypothetical protein PK771_07995 [Spirochaetota bacterium]|nr:hypothetical protein [Spirochaetota bacterium]